MSGPVRWKDDAELIRQTGIDLSDEASGVGGYDLANMRSHVLSQASGPGGGGGGSVTVAKGAAVMMSAAALLAGVGLYWVSQGQSVEVAMPQPVATAVAAPAVHIERAPVVETAVVAPPEVPVDRPAARPVRAPAVGTAEAVVEPPIVPDEAVRAEISTAPVAQAPGTEAADPAAAGTDLAEQMALYAVGQRALEAGDLAAAGSAFQEYLEAWPDGTLREEVLVSILEVLVRQQAWAEADALAASLMTVPTLSLRVGELTRVRAEALVHLGRCSDAMALVSGLEKADATKLRKACMR